MSSPNERERHCVRDTQGGRITDAANSIVLGIVNCHRRGTFLVFTEKQDHAPASGSADFKLAETQRTDAGKALTPHFYEVHRHAQTTPTTLTP